MELLVKRTVSSVIVHDHSLRVDLEHDISRCMYMELSVKRTVSSVIVHDHSFRVD